MTAAHAVDKGHDVLDLFTPAHHFLETLGRRLSDFELLFQYCGDIFTALCPLAVLEIDAVLVRLDADLELVGDVVAQILENSGRGLCDSLACKWVCRKA